MKKVCIFVVLFLLIIFGSFLLFKYMNKDTNNINDNDKKNNNKVIKKEKNVSKIEIDDVKKSIFKNSYNEAINTLEKMSIEEKIGQLFIVRYDVNKTLEFSNYYPGGYVLFAKDFEGKNKESLKNELNIITSKIPLAFAVDEEGGFVTRVSKYSGFRSEKFLSPKYYYENGGYELLGQMEKEKAELLLSVGLNVNFAPVADVSTNPGDFIYNRSFGHNAEETSEFIKNMVTYANNSKITSCLKHFPGYGNNKDTHTGSAYDDRSYETFTTSDYLPFEAGINEGVPMIMMSHNIISSIDSENPTSLSLKMHEELRNKLKFSGIIITDDLIMSAIQDNYQDASVRAVNSGNDLIITSDFINDYNKVLEAYNNKLISDDTINKAVARVIAWKYDYDII